MATVKHLYKCTCHPWTSALEHNSYLLGTAVKLENTYRAIMSRHVSVSSRWRFFKLSSAWAMEFSSADPRLALVRDVCILLEGEGTAGIKVLGRGQATYHQGQSSMHAQVERPHSEKPHQDQGMVVCGTAALQTARTTSSQRETLHGKDPGLLVRNMRDWQNRASLLPKHTGQLVMAVAERLSHADSKITGDRARLHSAHGVTSHQGNGGAEVHM